MKRFWGDEVDRDVAEVLPKLDRLTQYEHLNAAAQTLGVVSGEKRSLFVICCLLNTLLSRCPRRPQ